METDYRVLCHRLFGTDDVAKLEKIAKDFKHNSRNAGRKEALDAKTKNTVLEALSNGKTVNDIATELGITRQTISRFINEPPPDGYTMRMEYMYRTKPCTLIDVNFLEEKILIQNRTDDMLFRAFGVNENPTWDDFNIFLLDRCPSRTNGNIKGILNALGLTDYDPLQIVEKTQGRTVEDSMWLRFKYYGRGAHRNA